MKRAAILAGTGLFAFLILAVAQKSSKANFHEAASAARQGLVHFSEVFQETQDKGLGITSVEDFKKATLGEPLRVYFVRLDRLSQYNNEDDPKSLLIDIQTMFFPVFVEGNTKASIRVQRFDGTWKAVAFGRPAFSQLVVQQELSLKAASSEPEFIVEIPALNLFFLGSNDKAELMLSALVPSKQLGMEKGSKRKARDVFRLLVPVAKSTNPNLPQ